jgi:hypothetical protein
MLSIETELQLIGPRPCVVALDDRRVVRRHPVHFDAAGDHAIPVLAVRIRLRRGLEVEDAAGQLSRCVMALGVAVHREDVVAANEHRQSPPHQETQAAHHRPDRPIQEDDRTHERGFRDIFARRLTECRLFDPAPTRQTRRG